MDVVSDRKAILDLVMAALAEADRQGETLIGARLAECVDAIQRRERLTPPG